MLGKFGTRAILVLIGLVIIGAIGLIIYAFGSVQPKTTTPQTVGQLDANPPPLVSTTATILPTVSIPASPTPAVSTTATISPTVSVPVTITSDDKIAVGQPFVRSYTIAPDLNIKIVKVADPPLISEETALTVLHNRRGITLGEWVANDGQRVTLDSASYGAVTHGYAGPGGLWAGSNLNVQEVICPLDGDGSNCVPTGITLDHLENRLMWVFDFKGINQDAGVNFNDHDCWPVVTDKCTRDNHLILALDVKMLEFFHLGNYYSE